jgi:hypothetical protein
LVQLEREWDRIRYPKQSQSSECLIRIPPSYSITQSTNILSPRKGKPMPKSHPVH